MLNKDGKSTHLRTESDSNQLSDLNIINSQKTVEIFKTGSEAGHHFETINDTIKVSDEKEISNTNSKSGSQSHISKTGALSHISKTPTPKPQKSTLPGDLLSTDRVQNLDSKGDKTDSKRDKTDSNREKKIDIDPFETEEQELLEKQSPTTKKINRKQSNVLGKEQSFVAMEIGNEYDNDGDEAEQFTLIDKNTDIYFNPIVKDLPDLTFYDIETYGDNPMNLESIIPKEPEEKIS